MRSVALSLGFGLACLVVLEVPLVVAVRLAMADYRAREGL